MKSSPHSSRKISVAPMMNWTDRHCRFFHRQITRYTRLYTEMVTTSALLHGNIPCHLDLNDAGNSTALQLGGSEPASLAKSAKLGQDWGYCEINLNCGCPSGRVQKGNFGACLMEKKKLVADCIKAMKDAVDIDITVKHRIGIDSGKSYEFVRDFVGEISEAGCQTFIVHARNAILKGLSPKKNREIPPLKYEYVYWLARDFPNLEIIINGSIKNTKEIDLHLKYVDGVMLGREAYHNPYLMADFDRRYFGDVGSLPKTRVEIIDAMTLYINQQLGRSGTRRIRSNDITRHMLGLMSGMPGARLFRQALSNSNDLVLDSTTLLAADALKKLR